MTIYSIAKRNIIANAHRAALRTAVFNTPLLKTIMAMFPRRMRSHVSLSGGTYSDSFQFSVIMRDLDSLKDKRLIQVLETFATDPAWQATSTDYTYDDRPNRDFTFRQTFQVPRPNNAHTRWLVKHGYMEREREGYALPTMPVEVSIFISAYVKADSNSCRIEVVDRVEKVVVEEVKRIVCA
jgi:hypothetical protein